jgi:hypothetical protein
MVDIAVALTDYLLTLEGLYFAWASRRFAHFQSRISWMYAGLAASACLGGTFHGFFPEKTQSLAGLVLWTLTLASLGFTATVMWLLIFDIRKIGIGWRRVALAGYFVYLLYIMVWDRRFLTAMIFYAVPLISLAVIHRCFKFPILIILAGSILQQFKIGLGPEFNHNAVYHIIQFFAIALLFQNMKRDFGKA